MATKDKLMAGFKSSVDTEEMAAEAALVGKDFKVIPLDKLRNNSFNREISEDAVDDLVDSIKANGLGQPILVRPVEDSYEIISGHHRVCAFKKLLASDPNNVDYKVIPAYVRNASETEAKALLLATSIVNPLSSEERGRMYLELGQEVPKLRSENPEKYHGVASSVIIADMVNEVGGKTSKTTVNRHIAEARAKKELDEKAKKALSDDWKGTAETDEFKPSELKKISTMPKKEQAKLHDVYEHDGHGAVVKSIKKEEYKSNPEKATKAARKILSVVGSKLDDFEDLLIAGAEIEDDEVEFMREFLLNINDKLMK